MTAFVTTRRIEFSHCDPAGIVFYPRYFELLNSTVEEWFAEGLGVTFAELHLERGGGVPAAHIEVDFKAPSRLGDLVQFTLTLKRLGGSSVTVHIDGASAGQTRLKATLVLAHVDMQAMRPAPWPDDLHTAMQPYLQAENT